MRWLSCCGPDYGKNDGEVLNIYGGNETGGRSSEAFKFVFKGCKDGAEAIAEESTAWPMVTGEPKKGDWALTGRNMGWMNDFTNYMRCNSVPQKQLLS